MSDNAGGGPGPDRPQLIRLALRLPYSDLALSEKHGGPIELDDSEMILALVLPYGIGPNEPRLLRVDDTGALVLSAAAGSQGLVTITDDPGVSNSRARVQNDGDAIGTATSLFSIAKGALWNSGAWDRARSASAPNMNAKTGFGVQQIAPAGEFSVNHNPAAGAQATATQAAGAAGHRNIARRVSFGFSSQAVLAGVSTVVFNLRDGATGAGAILKSWTFDLPAAVIAPFAVGFEVADVGTAATAMTLETAAAVAGLRAFVNLSGFDAS